MKRCKTVVSKEANRAWVSRLSFLFIKSDFNGVAQ